MTFGPERNVLDGYRVVHNDKELIEKLGRNNPYPCGSRRQVVLHAAVAAFDVAARNESWR